MPHHLPRGLYSVWFYCFAVLVLAIFCFKFSVPVQADCTVTSCTVVGNPATNPIGYTVTVSGQVNETGLELQGYSAPNAFIIVSDETQIIGTGTATSAGTFDFIIHALQANSVHTITLQADNGSQRTPGTSFVVTVSGSSTTIVSNILLPTFIDVNPTAANPGDPITVSGTTVPSGVVTVYTESPLQSTTVNADATTGTWSVELISTFGPYPVGTYKAYAGVSYTGGLQSNMSRQVQFEVKSVASSTELVVNGYGPPNAFITFTTGVNTVIATGVVLSDGTFSKTISFPDQDQTVTVNVIADDGSQVTPATTFTATLVSTQTTTVNDVLLTTFISVNPDSTNVGSPITVSGVAANNSGLVLTVESPVRTATLTVDANGNWQDELIAQYGTLPTGVYRAHAHVTRAGGLVSPESRDVIFDIKDIATATNLVVTGSSAPNSFITFTENNAVVGTAVTNSLGQFSQTLKFPDQTLTRTITLVADNGTQVTPPTSFTTTLTAFSTTAVDNIVMPTFIDVNPLKAQFGSTVQALGESAPNASINLFVENPLASKTVTSDGSGNWTTDINSMYTVLEKGSYTAYARATLAGGYQSNLSREVPFDVIETDQCAERRSDLNCDGKVDITDVGILIFYWGDAGNGQKADINKDGTVDVTDVGLMMFDWTY